MRLWLFACIVVVAVAAGAGQLASARGRETPQWTIMDLGTLGGEGSGTAAINDLE